MSSLLTSGDQELFYESIHDLFDTFKGQIVVYKEAKQVVTIPSGQNFNFAFGDSQPPVTLDYTMSSGTCYAVIDYSPKQDKDFFESTTELPIETKKGLAKIKIEADNYSLLNESERIMDNGRQFRLVTSLRPKIFNDTVRFYIGFMQEIQ